MKKSGFNDKQIEEMLYNLPEIKDKRSPQEIFRKIPAERRRRAKRIWFGPVLASAAALFLLFLMFPFQADKSAPLAGGGSGSGGAKEESSVSSEQDSSREADTEQTEPGPERKEAEGAPEGKAEDKAEDKAVPDQPASPERKTEQQEPPAPPEVNVSFLAADTEQEKNRSLTVAYMDQSVNYTIPVTLISGSEPLKADQYNELIASFDESKLGLVSFLQDTDIRASENKEAIEIHIDEGRTISTSSEAMFAEIVKESFGGKGYSKADLFTGEKPEIDLGPLGSARSLDLQASNKKAIYKYAAEGSSAPLFAESNESYETFKEAYSNMTKDKNETMKTVMAEQAAVSSIDEQQSELILTFTENELGNNEQTIFMLEALLLTAKEFNYESVSFKGLNLEKVGTMDVTKPVKVPYGANPVQVEAEDTGE
ncbi:hypothetical protein GKZ89_02265 [Bacillus mangrovi]|uniref:GerMN domain-containing protein n=1 Tax=Metabacillus mangrovi TaxID=1491830 RepID=A0A7X2V3B7_9BACI|nr:hypothetical protein [Metabacillus mangrovi]MTH52215.1 hypothetical protein [Metabacillus mangrovi]